MRRKWKLVLWAGILLCGGPILGIVATIAGMLHSFRTIESAKAPTPGDLAVGVQAGLLATMFGLIAAIVGVALIVIACLRIHHRESSTTPA